MSDSDFKSLSFSTASSSSIQVIESLKYLQDETEKIFPTNIENLGKMSSKDIYKLFSGYYRNFYRLLTKHRKLLSDELDNYIFPIGNDGTAVIMYPYLHYNLLNNLNLFEEYCEVFKKLFKGNEEKGQLIIHVLENIGKTYQKKIKEEEATKKLQPNQKGRARSCSASF